MSACTNLKFLYLAGNEITADCLESLDDLASLKELELECNGIDDEGRVLTL